MNGRVLVGLALAAVLLGVAAGGYWWTRAAAPAELEAGLDAYARRDYAHSEKSARDRLKTHPDDVAAVRLLIRSLYRQGRDEPASAFLKRLAEPQLEAEDFYLLGTAYVRQGDPQSAILVWRRALGRDQGHVETLTALYGAMTRLDLLSEAARAARTLAEVPGSKHRGELMLGRTLVERGDHAAAAQALRIALERPEEWTDVLPEAEVRKQLARQLLRTGDPAGARQTLAKIANGRADPEACWLLARSDLALGKPTDPAIQQAGRGYRAAHPAEHEPAPYLGEAACVKCHADIARVQQKSRHARTFPRDGELARIPFPKTPVPDPANPRVTHEFARKDGAIVERTKVEDQVFETVVDYAFGSGDRGLTLVGRGVRDEKYHEMRMSYYAPPIGWDATSGHPTEPGLPAELYAGMPLTIDAVWRCLVCHATHPEAVLARSQSPEARDRAIGCEQCHGPGGHHQAALAAREPDMGLARLTETDGATVVGLCAQCHSPRSKDLSLSPGSPDAVRFQGATLTWSRCYSESSGALDCVTCHNPHQNVETAARWYESRCLTCHAADSAAKAAKSAAAHAATPRPCPVNPASGCVSCHMPKVETTMAHAAFTDHFIRARPPETATRAAASPGAATP